MILGGEKLTREEVFNKVAKIISNHFEIDTDKVTDELNIKDDLKLIQLVLWNSFRA